MENNSDLEEGEIRGDVLEDVSECSLSEILNLQDLKEDDSDIDHLREEALKSLSKENEEEVTEEELYRLEALKSLLANIESSGKKTVEKSPHKKKRKRKKKTKEKHSKRKKNATISISEQSEELMLPLELPCSGVAKTDDLPNKYVEYKSENYKKLETRSWYPKTEFALISLSSTQNSKTRSNDSMKLGKSTEKSNKDCKELIQNAIKSSNDCQKVRNEKESNNDLGNGVNGDFILVPKVLHTPITTKISEPIVCHRVPMLATVPNYVEPKVTPMYKSPQFKNVFRHPIRKFNSMVPAENKFSLRNNTKNEKYKIVNTSKYTLKKTSPKSKLVKRNAVQRSTYSINRVKPQYPRVNVNPKEFIIDLDSNDSDKEEASKENVETFAKSKDSVKSEKNYSYSDQVKINERILCPDNGVQSTVNESLSTGTENHKPSVEVLKFKNDDQIPSSTSEDKRRNELVDIARKRGKIKKTNDCSAVTTTSSQQTIGSCDEKPRYIEDAKQLLPEDLPVDDSGIQIDRMWSVGNSCSCVHVEEEFSDFKPIQQRKEEIHPTNSNNKMEMSEKNSNNVHKVKKIDKIVSNNNLPVLAEAEAILIEIRAKLLSNLSELEESIKANTTEKEKLNNMMKKMIKLKSMVLKFEEKIKLQKSKLSNDTNSMNSLFKGVATRTQTCFQLKEICLRAGREVIGPLYKPPDDYEHLIEEKRKTIDFSKYVTDLK